ncbi:hypothetical protein C5H21_01330 [Xylella fastidiosa]|nr:hypothetical protein C5H21_14280 [Xylella fastidiosa]TNW00134.1 hypothetical protein C5H21_01330 [Xylella fastidiosa]
MTYLKADGDIAMLAAQNTVTNQRDNRGRSAGVGVAVNLGSSGTSAGLTATPAPPQAAASLPTSPGATATSEAATY